MYRIRVGAQAVGQEDEGCGICVSVDQWSYLWWVGVRKEMDTLPKFIRFLG